MSQPTTRRLGLVGPTHPLRGGIAHHTTLLERALRQRGHEVFFCAVRRQYPRWLYPGGSDRDPSRVGVEAIEPVRMLDSMNPLSWNRCAQRLIDFAPEAVVIPWWVVFWAPCFRFLAFRLRRAGVPVVWFCHNVIEHEAAGWKRALTRWVLASGDGYVVQSDEEAQRLGELVGQRPIARLTHPDYGDLAVPEPRSGALPPRPRLLMFGFIRPYKGLDVLLDALGLLKRRGVPFSLRVAGECWDQRESYEARAAKNGVAEEVTFDWRYIPNEEIAGIFAETDLAVFPYRSVTGSGALRLALSQGAPVVAPRLGALPEIVRPSEGGVERGTLFDSEDPADLARALEEALDPQRYARLAEGASQPAPGGDWPSLVRGLEALLDSLKR